MIKTLIFDLNKVLVAYKNLNAEYKRTFGITQSRFWRPLEEFFGDHVMGKTSLDYFLIKKYIKYVLTHIKEPINKLIFQYVIKSIFAKSFCLFSYFF